MSTSKRILICPLDWGLGHATRCIPVIRSLLKKNAEVIIAAHGRSLDLLRLEFPSLEFIEMKGYDIHYPDNGSMALKMFSSIPKILTGIFKEHWALKKIISEKRIDIVISDNRFGLWNKNIKTVFITHQMMVKTPIGEKLLHKLNLSFIRKFDECWIPDVPGETNLSGDLSHKYMLPKNSFFIGVLSRFNKFTGEEKESELEKSSYDSGTSRYDGTIEFDLMVIISGPEPQRTNFEHLILGQLQDSKLKVIVVRGKTEEDEQQINGNVKIVSHLKSNEMRTAILNSKTIIARSGYSTIMDLVALGGKAIFIPTPGQTEQEYLGELFMQKKIALCVPQNEFILEIALKKSLNFKGFERIQENKQLENRINFILFST